MTLSVTVGRKVQAMPDIGWRPALEIATGMAAYYRVREEHERKLAQAAYGQWQEYAGLAEKYRRLAEKAAFSEGLEA